MNDNLFDKIIREKLYNFSTPGENGDWDALAARLSGRKAFLRRRRVLILVPAAAACLLLLFFLFMPRPGRNASAPQTVYRIVREPAALDLTAHLENIPQLYSPQELRLLRIRSLTPATSEITVPPAAIPSHEPEQDAPLQAAVEEPVIHKDIPVEEPVNVKSPAKNSLFPADPPKNTRLNKKWITAANFSYQGAINGTYLFTPSTYTTKWETPL
ncbi:MAG: hypothetical protein PHT64_00815, partial [Bacteroidales bacterium]|nr:hypothetical protein [Bacteroidales bacterium]